MKEYNPDAIRNLALFGHSGCGKTSLAEYMLYAGGETNRIGTVDDGNTQSDFNANEIEKKISIAASALHIEWKNTKINFLDTPGYTDFIGQVLGCLHVTGNAVCVLNGVEGVEVGTEVIWEYVDKKNLPTAIVINKLDSEKARFDEIVEMAKDRLSNDAIVVSFPVKEGPGFNTVVDVIQMKAFQLNDPNDKKSVEVEIPADLKEQAEALREELLEKVAESSEELLDKFFEEGTLSDEDFIAGMEMAIRNRILIPIFAVSSTAGTGVRNFLDFVSSYLPNPLEVKPKKGLIKDSENEVEIKCDPSDEVSLMVFKSLNEPHVGEMSIFKVFTGTLTPGMDLINVTNGKSERMGQLFILNGKNRKEVSKLVAGDIGAAVKLKDTHTSNTLAAKGKNIVIEPIEYPPSKIRGAVKPKAKGDEDKISTGLHIVHEEDPTLTVKFDPELGQTIISGQGETQMALAVKLLKDRYNVEVDLIEPRIPYRETIRGVVETAEYKHKKQSGGRGQYGHVVLKLEPNERGAGFEFVDAIVGGVVPGRFIPAVEKGLNEIMEKGILTGSRVIDVKVTLHFGSYHNVDSDEVSFKIAASQAFKKGFLAAKPVIMEPVYKVKVKVPEEYMGDVMGDLSSRRGKISGMEAEGPFQIINATVPLAELYKYSTHLRSITQGRGMHFRDFSHYEDVPKEVESKIIEEFEKSKEEE